MKKCLVVGGAGYIGGSVTDNMREAKEDFWVYDSLMYESIYLKDLPFVLGDVRDTFKLKELIDTHKFDTIVWLAAIVGDGACASLPEDTTEVNEQAVKWLCENFDGRIVFTSTCSVYGTNHDKNLNEESPTNPLSLYAGTKLAAEKYLLDRGNSVIFRLGTVHGLSDRFSRLRLDLVANALAQKAVFGQPMTVFGGEQWRPIVHVQDVGCALYHAAKGEGPWGQLNGVYNFSHQNIQIREIADTVKKAVPNAQIKYVDQKFEDLRNYHVSTEKLFSIVPYQFKKTLAQSTHELVSLFRSGRIKDTQDPVYRNEQFIKANLD